MWGKATTLSSTALLPKRCNYISLHDIRFNLVQLINLKNNDFSMCMILGNGRELLPQKKKPLPKQ
jgi:hypothetical protein